MEIELLLAGGAGQKTVATKHGLSKDSVHRHYARHIDAKRMARLQVGPVQEAALRARIAEENSSVIDQLRTTRAGLYESYDLALKAGDRNSVALLAGKIHENLRITGELASSPLIAITNNQQNVAVMMESPEFSAFQARLIAVLRDHPDARQAVIQEFSKLDAPSSRDVVNTMPPLTQGAKREQTIAV